MLSTVIVTLSIQLKVRRNKMVTGNQTKRTSIEVKANSIVAKTNKTTAQKVAMDAKIETKLDTLYPGTRKVT